MGRVEADREDWMREATALRPRAELSLPHRAQPVYVGFRGAAVSLYLGPDDVYHFSPAGALRRAYTQGRLWKAERHRLVALTRVRTPSEVQLVRQELDPTQQQAFLQVLAEQLQGLRHALQQGELHLVAEEPPEGVVLERLWEWLSVLPDPVPLAASARG